VTVKPPTVVALLLGLVPFAAMCFSVGWWDRIDPLVLGLPFNLAWLLGWVLLSTLCLAGAYAAETRRRVQD
jgi:Protein of unknown function (DUF3311)